MKPIQYFSDAYIEQSKKSSPTQIASFLDEFMRLHGRSKRSIPPMKLISLRISADLLQAVKRRALKENLPYQTWIKKKLEDILGSQ